MTVVKILAAITLVVSIGWAVVTPSFESALAVLGSLSALIATFFLARRNAQHTQQQTVSNSSVGVQAGGNVNVGNIAKDEHAK